MRAVRLHEYHHEPTIEETPEPTLQAPRDVIVRIAGAGVCRTDLHLIDGWLKDLLPVELPFTIGHENAGWVEAVGDEVTNVKEGDGVIVHPLCTCGTCRGCRIGEDMYCSDSLFPGVNADGGYAEYLRTVDRALVPLPESVHPASIAPYADAGVTAYRGARRAAAVLEAGDTAVVIGVGGLGHIGAQVLRELAPAKIVAVDRSPEGRALAESLDVDAVIDSEGAVEAVAELTGGRGAKAVLDFVGEGTTPSDAIAMLAQGGTYVVVGYGGNLEVPTMLLILKEVTVAGILVGSHHDLADLMSLVVRERVSLRVKSYPLDEALQALDDLEHGRIHGRAVLVP